MKFKKSEVFESLSILVDNIKMEWVDVDWTSLKTGTGDNARLKKGGVDFVNKRAQHNI